MNLFFTRSLKPISINPVGNGTHLKILFSDPSGTKIFDAIGFGLADKVEQLNHDHPKLAFHLEINAFRGHEKLQLNIVDVQ